MSTESDAYSALSAAVGVTALVSTRVFPDIVPQEYALPSVAMTRTGTVPIQTIHSMTPVASVVTIEMWCMAETKTSAEAVANAVHTALAAVNFRMVDRRPEIVVESDGEPSVWATVLTFEYWEQ